MEYGLWIKPPQPLFAKLQKIINDLANNYGSPTFTPHMTILGSVECDLIKIKKAAGEAVRKTNNLKLTLGPVSFSTTYYQSVFVRVNSTAKLMQLNLDLKKALNIDNNVFMPHISLLYGNHDMKTREKIASSIKLSSTSFIVSDIEIIPVLDNPNEWKPAAIISLGKKR